MNACEKATREYPRLTRNFCDYDPAHRYVRVQVLMEGRLWGQSCLRHALALAVDAAGTGELFELRLQPRGKSARV